MKKIAPINKIIPFSNVDGPSNRMAIFFQGCNFNCLFCHNPETINICNDCGACVKTCPSNALENHNGQVIWNREKCVNCDNCIKTCPNNSSPKITYYDVERLIQDIERVSPYIQGITLSGGECTLYSDFIKELFPRVQKMNLTCLLDSNGSYDYEKDPEILEYCDGVMLDVKAVDKDFSKFLISNDGTIVLKNLDYLLSVNKLYEVRTIIFPEKDNENKETVTYVSKHIQDKCFYKLIRYRQFGVREENLEILADYTTDEDYTKKYLNLALSLGASKAYIV